MMVVIIGILSPVDSVVLPRGPVAADAAEVLGAAERRVVGRRGPRPLLPAARRSTGGRTKLARVLLQCRGSLGSPSLIISISL